MQIMQLDIRLGRGLCGLHSQRPSIFRIEPEEHDALLVIRLVRRWHFFDFDCSWQRAQRIEQLCAGGYLSMRIAAGDQFGDAHPQLQVCAAWNDFFQFGRCIKCEYFAMIHDGYALAKLVGLFHVMRGQEGGHALLVERANAIPQKQARLRIEAVGRLVEEKHVGRVHQGARQHQALRHTAGVAAHFVIATIAQSKFFEQGIGARIALGARNSMIAGVKGQDFARAGCGPGFSAAAQRRYAASRSWGLLTR